MGLQLNIILEYNSEYISGKAPALVAGHFTLLGEGEPTCCLGCDWECRGPGSVLVQTPHPSPPNPPHPNPPFPPHPTPVQVCVMLWEELTLGALFFA